MTTALLESAFLWTSKPLTVHNFLWATYALHCVLVCINVNNLRIKNETMTDRGVEKIFSKSVLALFLKFPECLKDTEERQVF